MIKLLIKRKNIYDLYWYFAYERQNIFWNKIEGKKILSNDEIFQNYKFCNSYRVNDRVSQYLLKNVIYTNDKANPEDVVFRIILFKIFNKEQTWEFLEKELGQVSLDNFNFKLYSNVLANALGQELSIYNDAYMSCANKAFGYERKHENHIALIEKMFIKDSLANKIIQSKNMQEGFNILKSYPLIGNFMAYQLITDINYSEIVDFSETEFTVAGPGSERGIKKCFENIGKYTYEDVIKYMTDNQEKEFNRLGYNFKRIGNRKLQYIDCQNIFCEVDKYCRQAFPELKSNRSKIKKKYTSSNNKISYIYPPKWNINI